MGVFLFFSYILVPANCDHMKYNFGAFLNVCMWVENVQKSKRNLINFGMNKVYLYYVFGQESCFQILNKYNNNLSMFANLRK